MVTSFDIVRPPVDTVSWTPIEVTIHCSRIVIHNAASDVAHSFAFRVRSDDGGSEKPIQAGEELDINTYGELAFEVGHVVGYVKAAVGAGPCIVSFTR